MPIDVIAEGLDIMKKFVELAPERSKKAAALALNQIAGHQGLTLLRRATQDEINFPAGYVNAERLYLSRRATDSSLEVRIAGRDQATSLARFAAAGTAIRGKDGVKVSVHRGKTANLKKSFLTRLNSGNIGLAVRVPYGQILAHTTGAVEIKSARTGTSQLYLLYGPSIDQVFREVSEEKVGTVLEMISSEFVRQFNRDNL